MNRRSSSAPPGPTMNAGPVPGPDRASAAPGARDRVDPSQRLLREIGELRVRAAGRDLLLLRLGVVLMVVGPGLTIIGYLQSSQTSSAFNQNDATIVAIMGLAIAVVGVGLFLRYSLAEFLRFWLARLIAEQHRQPVPPKRAPIPHDPAGNSRSPAAPVPAPDRPR